MNSIADDARLCALLDRLHARSIDQGTELKRHTTGAGGASVAAGTPSVDDMLADRPFWKDKLVALDRDKAEFCYRLCRATGARTIVEAGTSWGVSTLYLAAAVRDNGGGVVIGTEYEAEKAAMARRHFAEAGLTEQIDLREGDLRETLKAIPASIDFLLMDIWAPMVMPVMHAVAPHLRRGAVIVADNTARAREHYATFFAYLAEHGYTTQTLPFDGGLEMAVKLA
ncbi:MAG TPA: class I SAM-dependent methyltransferase [Nevskiaceae bacterium]